MAAIENLNIDEHKTLHNNRDKIVDLIFNHPRKYLNEELFEKLCNNDELTNEDINRELIKDLYFENLEIDEIYYLEQVDEILVWAEDGKLELGESSNRSILEPRVEPSNVESYLNKEEPHKVMKSTQKQKEYLKLKNKNKNLENSHKLEIY